MIPTTSTHCNVCKNLVLLQQMEEHAKAHLPPTSRTPFTREQRNPSKLLIPSLDLSTDNSCEDLRSILPDTLPAPIKQRNCVQIYTNNASRETQLLPQSFSRITTHSSNLPHSQLNSQQVSMEELNTIAIVKKISLTSKAQNYQTQHYKPYQNSFTLEPFKDETVASSKIQKQSSVDKKDLAYEIKKKGINTNENNTQQSKQLVDVSLGRNKVRKIGQQEGNNLNRNGNQQRINQPPSHNHQQNYGEHQGRHPYQGPNICDDCGGYYCKTCKSTVPPALRYQVREQELRPNYNPSFRRQQSAKGQNCHQCKQ